MKLPQTVADPEHVDYANRKSQSSALENAIEHQVLHSSRMAKEGFVAFLVIAPTPIVVILQAFMLSALKRTSKEYPRIPYKI